MIGTAARPLMNDALVRRVLLVDDDADIRIITTMSLEQVGGWEVVVATSGAEALTRATEDKPDVILLDVTMPGMDGRATLAHLKASESTRTIPVIFMTARVQRKEVERYMELGAAGVISKPFDPMLLPGEVLRLLGS